MIVLSANNLTKTYGTDVIIDKASFHLNAGDKVGIIGRNGAGKTTLLNMLTGELPCDGGEFFVSQNTRIGYLKQRDNFNSEGTVLEEIEGIFSGLRELENEIAELSDKVAENPQDTGLLNRLDELQTGDVLTLYTNYGRFTYVVQKNIQFENTDKQYILPTDSEQLTLYTCEMQVFGSSSTRIGVVCDCTDTEFYVDEEAAQ